MSEPYEVIYKTFEFPSGLITAEEAAEKLKGISANQLKAFADSTHAPHFRINGGEPLFKISELKRWIAENALTVCEGKPMPKSIQVVIPGEEITEAPPESLSNVLGLQQMPKYGYLTAVYFLCHEGSVVYVGQSKSPSQRVATHVAEGEKVFDRVYLLPTPAHELDRVESAFIYHLKPKYNGINHGKITAPQSQAKVKGVVELHLKQANN